MDNITLDKYDIEDYHKRYSGTYTRVLNKETKEISTFYIKTIIVDPPHWSATCLKGNKQENIHSEIYEILGGFPTIGATNCGKEVIITSRTPARQWKRGICYDNFKIQNPLYEVIKCGDFPIKEYPIIYHELDLHTISECFNNTFFDIKEAINKVQNLERFGAAINNVFWFSPSWYNSSIVLWYKQIIVGEYIHDKLIIVEKAFEQEIKDTFGETLCLYPNK